MVPVAIVALESDVIVPSLLPGSTYICGMNMRVSLVSKNGTSMVPTYAIISVIHLNGD